VYKRQVTGSETAKTMYGANGWVLHHNTDLWRIAGPVDGFWGFSPTCGAWLTMNLFETYLFNGNKKYLEELYPVLKEASVFFLETLWEKPETGELMVSPASSPENTPFDDLFLFEGTTMSTQNVFILFSNTIKAANDLDIDREFIVWLEEARQKLPPMKIGKHAQLQEWYEDWDRINDHHRHVSHMLGLYPGNMISPFKTPELFEALKNSLEYRTDISTGWSMGWKVCLWARLLDGNRAMKLLKNQLTPIGENHGQGEHSGGTYPNLFDAHPPFQIDGNFGCTAGIAEMLLQSHDGAVFVLPALPGDLKSGKVKGLKARGGFEINCEWEDGEITKLSVYSVLGGNLRLRVFKGMISGTLGKEMRQAVDENTNPFYSIPNIKKPSISEMANLNGLNINPVVEYDLPTKPGKEYNLVK
jgi:alpha-L-fucosidase 2